MDLNDVLANMHKSLEDDYESAEAKLADVREKRAELFREEEKLQSNIVDITKRLGQLPLLQAVLLSQPEAQETLNLPVLLWVDRGGTIVRGNSVPVLPTPPSADLDDEPF